MLSDNTLKWHSIQEGKDNLVQGEKSIEETEIMEQTGSKTGLEIIPYMFKELPAR